MNRTDDNNPNHLEAIEACRSGRDDPFREDAGPEMADLAAALGQSSELRQRYEAMQRSDAAIRAALEDVECPTGLTERLAARLAAESAQQAPGEVAPATSSRPWSRRRWALGSLAATAVAACVLAGVYVAFQPRSFTLQQVLAAIPSWDAAHDVNGWRRKDVPPNHLPSNLLIYLPDRLTTVDTADDADAVVYAYDRVSNRPNSRVLLFVVRGRGVDMPSRPPRHPHFDTGAIQIGVWAEGDLVYSLVVISSEDDTYRRLTGQGRVRTT